MKMKIKLGLALSVLSGIALSVFMIICNLKYVDPYTLLVTPSGMVTAFMVLCTAAVVLAFALPYFTLGKIDVSDEAPNSSFLIFSSSLLGFLFAGYVLHAIVSPLREMLGSVSLPSADIESFGKLLRVLYIAGVVLAVPSAVYFILVAVKKTVAKNSLMSILATSPVLFCAVKLVAAFMSTSAKVNSAGRRITIVTFCLCIFFFLYEAILLAPKNDSDGEDKDSVRVSRRYIASGYAAIVALLTSKASLTVLQAFWLIEVSDTYILNGIYITMILYIMARINMVSVKKI